MRLRNVFLIGLFAGVMFGQEIKMPANLDRLAKVAKDSVNVNLSPELLQLGAGFLSDSDKDEAHVKRLVSKLRGIYVRTFEFDKPGVYSKADIESVRSQLGNWSRMASVESKDDNTWIYVKKKGDAVDGIFIISAEPTELAFVNIEGQIDPKDLSELSGQMGIPKIDLMHTPKSSTSGGNDKRATKEDEAEESQ